MSKKILVTGANGQLGQELQELSKSYNYDFTFTDKNELDITDSKKVNRFFKQSEFDFCINAAAYTKVDLAETESNACRDLNIEAVATLAEVCDVHDVKMIHISTDFVFDGERHTPYAEDDYANPLSVYGKTKLEGEQALLDELEDAIIIRTSWLYSTYGKNFVKTMLELGDKKKELSIVSDQIGSPTYAKDLAKAILKIISSKWVDGIYHFSNEGLASWYDFAHSIFEMTNKTVGISPIKTVDYKTDAQRPLFSLLDKSKIKKVYNIQIRHWRDALREMLDK
jgi:dTDP-4-dehydrorhamnose reductase